jgi:hypothetical protein
MKIETIYVLERMNKGNYEHIEMSATAKIEEGEDALTSMFTLKTLVNAALVGKLEEIKAEKVPTQSPVTYDEETHTNLPVEEVKEKKEKKAKTTKKVVEEVPVQAEVPLVEEKPKKGIVLYDSNVKEHKSLFGGYLTKKYQDAWKTAKPAAEIKEFTSSLNGKEFIDSEGKFVSSFLDQVHAFFG